MPDKVLALTNQGDLLWEFEAVRPEIQEGGFGFWLANYKGSLTTI